MPIAEGRQHAHETLIINAVIDPEPENPEPRTPPVIAERPVYRPTDGARVAPLVVSSHLPDRPSIESAVYPVQGVECTNEFSYWAGFASAWNTDMTIVNVEQDMEYRDDYVAELADCAHPLCAFPYQVYPSALGRFIYCATTSQPELNGSPQNPRWVEGPADEWAVWSSIGFCKIAPEARVKPLDKIFWQWLEHAVNRVVTGYAGLQWHLHWPEIRHNHNYETVPDHLW